MRIYAQRVFEDQFRHDIGIVLVCTSDQDDSAVDAFRSRDLRRQVTHFVRSIRYLLVENSLVFLPQFVHAFPIP